MAANNSNDDDDEVVAVAPVLLADEEEEARWSNLANAQAVLAIVWVVPVATNQPTVATIVNGGEQGRHVLTEFGTHPAGEGG
jgi:hypothetical protein